MTPSDENIRRAGKAVLEHWKERMLVNARLRGLEESERPVYENAFWALLVAIEGGWVVSRMTHSTDPITTAKVIYRQTLQAGPVSVR